MKFNPIDVLEVGYRGQPTMRAWLSSIAEVTQPALDVGHGLFGCLFVATPKSVEFETPVLLGCPDLIWELAQQAQTRLTPEEQRANLRKPAVYATVSERLGRRGSFRRHWMYAGYQKIGLEDFALLTSMDVDGHGFVLGAPRKKISSANREDRTTWTLIAAHLRSAARLHRSSVAGAAAEPEAILTPNGQTAHAIGPAQSKEARESLRDAAKAVDRARSSLRNRDQNAALELWPGLFSGRWSLIDRFESDGRRYLVAIPNGPNAPPILRLTERERQIVGYAALGHTNKMIRYDLGLTDSAVSQTLRRAMLKLSVRHRSDLIGLAGATAMGEVQGSPDGP